MNVELLDYQQEVLDLIKDKFKGDENENYVGDVVDNNFNRISYWDKIKQALQYGVWLKMKDGSFRHWLFTYINSGYNSYMRLNLDSCTPEGRQKLQDYEFLYFYDEGIRWFIDKPHTESI